MTNWKGETSMSELKEFAFNMRRKGTSEIRIKKVKAIDVNHAHCNDVGCDKEWEWTGSESWHNVSDHVEHIGGGYYKFTDTYRKEWKERYGHGL